MQPLAGTTVADLTRYLPGPFASRELQRLGARVVKIEPPDGDPTRTPPRLYEALNGGKEIARRGTRAASRLRRRCSRRDVVLEGFRPGRLGAARRRAAARRTILCSITGFGADGPHATQAGHDLNYLGYAGALADTAPALPPVQVADLAAGAQGAVIEILAALLERARSPGAAADSSISMTHGSHQLVAHRLAGDPSAPADRRRSPATGSTRPPTAAT